MSTVVILISDKRSGSTMFQRELCRHPDVSHVEYSPHAHYETHHWLKGAVMLGMAKETFSGGRRYPGYGSRENARAYLIDCIRGNIPDYEIRTSGKALVFDSWEALCDKYANPVFFEKSPQYIANWASLSLLIEWIERTNHDVKIIGLTRNPMSVLYSAQKLFYTNPKTRQFSWLELQKNLLTLQAMINPRNYLHCRYEDLISNPTIEFSKVCRFIGLAENSQVGMGVHADSHSKWLFDADFEFVLDDTVARFALHFGYSPQDMENHGSPEESWYQKFRCRVMSRYRRSKAIFFDRYLKPTLLRIKK